MELSKALREASKLITGKQQLIVASVAKALEIVPRQLRCVLPPVTLSDNSTRTNARPNNRNPDARLRLILGA
eukprot:4224-Heterococcus_DN1.PRE.2